MKDRSAFQLAIENPKKDQTTSSHLTIGAFIIFENNSAVDRSPMPAEVQLCGPNHHFCSMPEWYIAKDTATSVDSRPKNRRRVSWAISQTMPISIARAWGHLCQIHILHGL